MDVDALVNTTLKGLGVPVTRGKHKGKDKAYVEYSLVLMRDTAFADDDSTAEEYTYRADIYSIGDFIKLMHAMKRALKAAGFDGIVFDPEIYESDTGYFHIPAEFKFTTQTEV